MGDGVQNRINKSRSRTVNLVWPIIRSIVGGNELIQIEGFAQLHPALRFLDAAAGIDHIMLKNDVGVGLASRVQNGDDFPHKTFTVRYELRNGANTEYARHLKQLSTRGAIKPLYWCHSYISKKTNQVLRTAVAYAADIIHATGDESLGWLAPPNNWDGNRFWAIDWKLYRDVGNWVWIWDEGVWMPPRTTPTRGTQESLF